MKEIYIYGDIVDKEIDKTSQEDVCPQDVITQLNGIEDDVTIRINSCGGSVSAGLAIATYVQNLGRKTTCIVDGVAASIASVIACACDELVMHPSSYLMIHRVWGYVTGNSEDLRKEADTMEMMTKSLIKIYQRKFDLSEDEIARLLAEETWISGEQAGEYKIAVTVDDVQAVKYAAKINDKKFNKLPTIMKDSKEVEKANEEVAERTDEVKEAAETPATEEPKVEETTAEEPKVEEPAAETPATEEPKAEEPKAEEPEDGDSLEDLKRENEELKKQVEELTQKIETLTSENVDKRVSGMQSKMQNKINDLVKEHTEKIAKYENEIKVCQEKLEQYEKDSISLKGKLEKTEKELSEKVSALAEKETALNSLNSSVLGQADLLPTFAEGLKNCKTLNDRVLFINSGKYTN